MKKIIGLAILATALTGTAALAGFVTSSVGGGAATNANAAPALSDIFTVGDTSAPTLATTLAALNTCLVNNTTCATNQKTAALDTDGDGVLSQAEILQTFQNMSCLSGVPTQDKYARAVIMEVNTLGSIDDCTALQTAITTATGYSVDAPTITASSIAFNGTNSMHSAILGISDGLGNALSGSGSSSTSVSATHSTDTDAANRFAVSSTGNLVLASGVDVEDLEPGVYTVSVTASDSNALTYGLSTTEDVSLTVSNEKGCIINNGIQSSDFSAGGDSSIISGATVTISGNHNANDKLFLRSASSISTDNSTGDVSYSGFGVGGVSANYDKSSGELVFTGSTTLTNWISTFKKVGYIYDDNGSSGATRSLIFSLSDNIPYNHADGSAHFYNFISGNISFANAITAANNSTLFGLQGYLVTITSSAEQDYIYPKIGGQGWIGACDRLGDSTISGYCGLTSGEVNGLKGKSSWVASNGDYSIGDGEGYWYWVSGPERLDYMGHDEGNSSNNCRQRTYVRGSNVFNKTNADTTYTNFKGGEPNNYLVSNCSSDTGGENMMHFYSDGRWNDYNNGSSSIQGYLIEYGGMSGDPAVDLTQDKTYTIATEGQFCAYQ